MNEQESIAYIEEWDVTEAAKVLKWYEDDKLLRPCDCDTIVAIETEDLKAENAKLWELVTRLRADWESERDYAGQMEAKEKQAVGENAKLRKMCSELYRRYWDEEGDSFIDPEMGELEERLRELGIETWEAWQ